MTLSKYRFPYTELRDVEQTGIDDTFQFYYIYSSRVL